MVSTPYSRVTGLVFTSKSFFHFKSNFTLRFYGYLFDDSDQENQRLTLEEQLALLHSGHQVQPGKQNFYPFFLFFYSLFSFPHFIYQLLINK